MLSFPTPYAVVDLDIVENNIRHMAEKLQSFGIKHRPHIKSHKSIFLAKKQLEAGAQGITCAKLSEAEVMAEAGLEDILIAFPIVGKGNLERFFHLAQKVKVSTCVDSIEVAEGLSSIGVRLGKKVPVYIEVDGGIHRCGRQPGEDTVQFARSIQDLPGIYIKGILSYAGQIYGESNLTAITNVAAEEARLLQHTAEMLLAAGIPIEEISAGSSISSKFPEQLQSVTEVRAGNYIFHDVSQLSTGLVTIEDCALRIIATVVSTPSPGRAIIDAGSKTLTTDLSHFRSGYGYIIENPDIEITKLNEEHGFLSFHPSTSLHIGQQLTIIPNHACVIPNLFDELIAVRRNQLVQKFCIDARGKNY